MKRITFGSICSGIEAASVAWLPLGLKALWLSKIEPYPCRVLTQRFPETPNLGDITAPDFATRAAQCGKPDIIVVGTPCQAFSVAGLRRGLADERGNLTLRYVEICNAIGPTVCVWENVPGVLSSTDNAFGCFLGALVEWAGGLNGRRATILCRSLGLDTEDLIHAKREALKSVVKIDGHGDVGKPISSRSTAQSIQWHHHSELPAVHSEFQKPEL